MSLPGHAQQPVEWYSSGAGAGQYAAAAYAYDQPSASASGGAAYGSFEDEAPLLEELGIDVSAILRRARAVLTGRLGGKDMEALDLGGPLLLMAALGLAHLLAGKLHFGYILGWTVVGSLLMWFVVNSVAGPDPDARALDAYSVLCLLGYGLLPLVGHAAGALLLPRRSGAGAAAGAGAAVWSAATAARLFVRRSPMLEGQGGVIFYPCLLMYSAFALLTLY